MKTKNLIVAFICCLLVGYSIHSFAIEKQDRNVTSFTKVSVSGGIDLYLTQGNTLSVSIETEKDILDKIETKVENGTLIIKLKKGEKINWRSYKGKLTLIAHVSAPTIEHVQGSGGSDIYPQTPINTNGNFGITLSGGADLKNATINAKNIEMKLSGGSDAKQFTANATTFIAQISGGSDIDNATVNAPDINIQQSGGSDAKLNVNCERLDVRASGGSDLTLSGKTNTITVNASGASDIKASNFSYESSDINKSGSADVKLRK
ncbi:MAG: DUF2807 domain-containing protein [Prevotellaceae bacterium]|jgi:hypothetical protein|nr:DUF2807 domain-containing protein [Prevotellaceae bacterium]